MNRSNKINCGITYDRLTALAAGDLEEKDQTEIQKHISRCPQCQKRMVMIKEADSTLQSLSPVKPAAAAVLMARRAISEVTRNASRIEIMTLDEVADFLRITPDELGEIVEQLPAFELAGRIRVRRARLIEWIQQRERDFSGDTAASWAARADSDEFQAGIA